MRLSSPIWSPRGASSVRAPLEGAGMRPSLLTRSSARVPVGRLQRICWRFQVHAAPDGASGSDPTSSSAEEGQGGEERIAAVFFWRTDARTLAGKAVTAKTIGDEASHVVAREQREANLVEVRPGASISSARYAA